MFCVSVPVLSEHITETLPRPSTACSFLMMACSLAIFCVPNDSTIVTIELSASGIAATASATANRNASPIACPLITLIPNSMPQNTSISIESFFPKLSRLFWSGVFFSDVVFRRVAIFPTSVSMPMAVTRNSPLP